MSIHIITDTGADIAPDWREDVTVLPFEISFGDKRYKDGVDLTTEAFYDKLENSKDLPTTGQITPYAFEEAFKAHPDEDIIVIPISGDLSGTYQSAVAAAQDYPNVRVVDSRGVTVSERILIEYALSLIEEGKSADEVVEILEREKHKIHHIALLDTLEYLKKGGRIGRAAAFVGGVLSIKPVIEIKDGKVEMLGKARGSKNGGNLLTKEVKKYGIDRSRPFALGYTGNDDALLQQYIKDTTELWGAKPEPSDQMDIVHVGSAIGTHAGPGAITIAFFEDPEAAKEAVAKRAEKQ